MPFAAALSEHPVAAHAIGEVTGQVLEAIDEAPDLALLFLTGNNPRDFGDAAEVVRQVIRPRTLVGCSAVSVLANGREVEESPAVALWAGRFGPVSPARFAAGGTLPDPPPFEPGALLLFGDPFTFGADDAFSAIEERWPGLPVVGGMASAARAPGGNHLLVDGGVFTSGAVGAFVGPGLDIDLVVSQGCSPVGRPYAVTAAEGNVVHEMGGRPAIQRLRELTEDELSDDELATVRRGGLHVGRVIDERRLAPSRGDFLVRNLIGANEREGWIAVAEKVEVGETLQYHLRDAESADDDLRALLAAKTADAALVFTCNGRGTNLFGQPHHDASVVDEYLGRPAAAGFFAAGEFGPIGGRNFVHGFTASIALLRDRAVSTASTADAGGSR